jgi:hypothetical protein
VLVVTFLPLPAATYLLRHPARPARPVIVNASVPYRRR